MERRSEEDSHPGHCMDHSGIMTRLNILVVILSGNGALLLAIFGYFLYFDNKIGVNMNGLRLEVMTQVTQLERRISDLELQFRMEHPDRSLGVRR